MTLTNHPTPESEREAIARIIDPEVQQAKLDGRYDRPGSLWCYREQWSLQKADAILSRRVGGEPVAWRILCTRNGATGYLYTEQLPFEPGPGVRVRREPEPLYAFSPAPTLDARTVKTLEKIIRMVGLRRTDRRTDHEDCHCTVCEMRDVAVAALAAIRADRGK
jgi:hypothetical protein